MALEKDKIKGAIRTDFVLSAEIIIITLGTVATATFVNRLIVLSGVSLIMTVGVYGLVALIVKLDDMGLYLKRSTTQDHWQVAKHRIGDALLAFAPRLMKSLTVIGTIAMFLVGGGILTHGLPVVHHWMDTISASLDSVSVAGPVLATLAPMLVNVAAGVLAGALVLLAVTLVSKFFPRKVGSSDV